MKISSNVLLVVGALCAAPFLFAVSPQKRASEKKTIPFEVHLTTAAKAWEAKHFGSVTRELSAALTQARTLHRDYVTKALPDPGPEWELVVKRKGAGDQVAMATMFGMVSGMLPIEHEYKHAETGTRLQFNLTLNSPMVKMMGMAMNPALMDEGTELIEYSSDKAVLKKKGTRSDLTVVLDGQHLLQAIVRDQSKDFLLLVVDQKAVDRLKSAILQ